MLKRALLATIAAVSLGAALAPVPASAQVGISINIAPPPVRYEAVPVPRRGYVWVPGYWDWRGNQHVWTSGTWVRERPGFVYQRPVWVERDGHWQLHSAAWAKGDSDHDGIPNGMDHDRNNDGIRDSQSRVMINIAPPPLRYEVVPAPRRGYVWVPGYWDWRGNRHAWTAGTWVRERPGFVYQRPVWVQIDGRWQLHSAAWAKGDSDHDGVPNSRDLDRNNNGMRDSRELHPGQR